MKSVNLRRGFVGVDTLSDPCHGQNRSYCACIWALRQLCVYHGYCYITRGSPSPGDGICRADTEQRWCRVMDALQLFVANDRLSVSDAAKKTFITEVSPPPAPRVPLVPLVPLSVAALFVTLLLILHLKSFFSFGWTQTIMEVFKVDFPLFLPFFILFICCVKPTEHRQTTWLRLH